MDLVQKAAQRLLEEQQGQQAEEEFNNFYYEQDLNMSYTCPSWAPIVGFTGIACAVVFASKFM
jgi:hypothetical protein